MGGCNFESFKDYFTPHSEKLKKWIEGYVNEHKLWDLSTLPAGRQAGKSSFEVQLFDRILGRLWSVVW